MENGTTDNKLHHSPSKQATVATDAIHGHFDVAPETNLKRNINADIAAITQPDPLLRLQAFFATRKVQKLATYKLKVTADIAATVQASHGYLYRFDEEEKLYKRLEKQELDKFFTPAEVEELYDNPESGLKRSDFFGTPSYYFPYHFVDYSAYKPGEENNVWLMPSEGDKKVYAFPKGSTIHPITNEPFEIHPEGVFFQINKDEAIIKLDEKEYIVILDSNNTNQRLSLRCSIALYLLEKAYNAAKEQNDTEAMQQLHNRIVQYETGANELALGFMGSSNINPHVSLLRLTEWNPHQYFSRSPKEKDQDYNQRLKQYPPLSELWQWQRELYDKSGFSLADNSITLKRQLIFFGYYRKTSEENRAKIHTIFKKHKLDTAKVVLFFEAFTICEHDMALGDLIIKLVEKNSSEADNILQYMHAITEAAFKIWNKTIDDVVDTLQIDRKRPRWIDKFGIVMEQVDFPQFYSVFLRKTKEMLEKANKESSNDVAESFDLQRIVVGACMNGFIQKKGSDTYQIINYIQDIFPSVKIEIIGQGEQGRQTQYGLMREEDGVWEYPYPEIWNAEAHAKLEGFIDRSLDTIDKDWAKDLKARIPINMANKSVKKVLIQYNGHVIGTIFAHDLGGGLYYVGTHYVDEQWQKDYNIGNFLQMIMLSLIPPGSRVIGYVAVANAALERQIGLHGIGIGLTKDGQSKELVMGEWNYKGNYATKNRQVYTDKVICEIAEGSRTFKDLPNAEKVAIFKTNSEPNENQEFIALMEKHFKEEYVMTRIFYRRNKEGDPDRRQTYIVFEKNQEPKRSSPQDSHTSM